MEALSTEWMARQENSNLVKLSFSYLTELAGRGDSIRTGRACLKNWMDCKRTRTAIGLQTEGARETKMNIINKLGISSLSIGHASKGLEKRVLSNYLLVWIDQIGEI